MTPLSAAIVGLGWWGKLLVEAVQGTSEQLRFVQGVARTPRSAAEFADAHGLRLVTTLEEALADPAVEAIVLATPHSQHVDQVIACAAAGKPVFCEKPLALTLAEARRAVEACERAGVVLAIGTDKRVLPAVLALKALIDGGELGTVLHVEGQYSNDNMRNASGSWRQSAQEAPGGGMSGPGLHALDDLLNFAGPAREVDARILHHATDPAPVDAVAGRIAFASGATGVFATVRGVPDYFRLSVFGTGGWAEVRGFDTLTTRLSGREPATQSFAAPLDLGNLLERFAQAVRGERAFPVSHDEMLDTVAAFEAAIASLERGETVAVQAAR